MAVERAGQDHAGVVKQAEAPELARQPGERDQGLALVGSSEALSSRLRVLSPVQLHDLHGSLGNRSIAAQLHPTVATRASRAFPVSARRVALQSGFAGMGLSQASLTGEGLLGASRGLRVALAPTLYQALQTERPGAPAERTLYHELAHTRQRLPTDGGAGDDLQIAHDAGNEAEADALADRARRGEVVEATGAAPSDGPPRVQALLSDERRKAEGRRRFAEASKAYELNMGKQLRTDPAAHEAADNMLAELQQITSAWAITTGAGTDDVLEKAFGWTGGDKYYGAFRMTATNINNVFADAAHRPLREKLKIVYNAIRNNNFALWIKVAAHQVSEEMLRPTMPRDVDVTDVDDGTSTHVGSTFAPLSGLRDKLRSNLMARLEAHGAVFADAPRDPTTLAPVFLRGDGKHSQAMAWNPRIQGYNRDRVGGMNRGRDAIRMTPLKMKDIEDLTDAEIDQIGINQGRLDLHETSAGKLGAFRKTFRSQAAKGNQPVPWEKGTGFYDVLIDSFTDQISRTVRARLVAGVSGSTDLVVHAANYLAFTPDDLLKLRLAMLGWMLEAEDHSFFEIMEAAATRGVPFDRGTQPGEMYEVDANFAPKRAADFRMRFDVEGAPDEPAYPSVFLAATSVADIELKDPKFTVEMLRRRYGADGVGIPDEVLRRFDEVDMADVEQLARAVQDARLKAASSSHQEHNFQERRRLRGTAAFGDLTHRRPLHAELVLDRLIQHHHGDHALGAYESALLRAAKHLPGAAADEAARRRILSDAGVPAQIVGGLAVVDVNQAVELRALLRSAGLDVRADRDDAALRRNTAKLDKVKQMRPYQILQGRIGTWLTALFGALLAELDPGLRHEGLSLANTSPEADKLAKLGVPEAIAAALDGECVKLAARVARAAATQVRRTTLTRAEILDALIALETDAKYVRLTDTVGEHNMRIIVHGAARRAGFDHVFTTKARKKTAAPARTAATLGEVLDAGSRPLDATALADLKAEVYAFNFPRASIGDAALSDTSQRMDATLDDVTGPVIYTTAQKAAYRGLDPLEIYAINQYTQHYGMGVWQGMLAARNSVEAHTGVGEKKAREQAPVMKAAVSGLNRLPVHSGRVYNGQPYTLPLAHGGAVDRRQVDMFVWGCFPIGRIIRQDTFFSTAKSIGASFISKPTHNLAWVIDEIRTGRDIQPISDKPGEEEVLFPPGAKFMVQSFDTSNVTLTTGDLAGKVVIHLVEL
jgi:hypothetical protein